MSILARAALQNKWAWVGERIDSSEGEQSTACGRMICSDAQANNKGFLSYKQRRTTRSVLVSMPWKAVGHSVIVATHCTRTSSMCWTTKWLERVRIRFDRSREASGNNGATEATIWMGLRTLEWTVCVTVTSGIRLCCCCCCPCGQCISPAYWCPATATVISVLLVASSHSVVLVVEELRAKLQQLLT